MVLAAAIGNLLGLDFPNMLLLMRVLGLKGGKVILLSHFGRPNGPDPTQTLKLLTPTIAAILERPVAFAENCIGERASAAVTP
jgi:phosphoglycerate kinase